MAQPTPKPLYNERAVLENRQFGSFIDSIIGGGGGNDDTTTTPTTTPPITTPTSTTTTTTPITTPTTTSTTPTSTLPTSSVRTTLSEQTTLAESTSNGQVVTVTSVVSTPVVISETPTSTNTSAASNNSSSSNGGLIGGVVGGVVGGLALITALVAILILWRRRASRTGHGWFLCFGRKPSRQNDLDVDWPTFDPTAGAAGVGGTFGNAGAGNRSGAAGGTLPDVDDRYHGGYQDEGDYNENGMGYNDEMRDVGSYSVGAGAGATSYGAPTSEGTHYRQSSQQWHPSAYSSNGLSEPPQSPPTVPDYSHLDAPEVREERARQQAQAQAMAAAAAAGGFSHHAGSSPSSPPVSYGSPPASPPPQSQQQPQQPQRPVSAADHRLSQGTAQMLADNNFFMANDDDETGTAYQGNSNQRLQVHNPDRY